MRTFAPDPVQYTYTPNHSSLGTVSPGERFTVLTEDGFTGRYADPANFTPETAAWVEENLDGVTGPIVVAGCEAGEAVAVTIETLEVTTPGCVVVSRCEAHSPLDWWQEEDHVVNLPVADGRIELDDGWTVPARPLIGCLATAPARETVFSKYEGSDYLGNVDCRGSPRERRSSCPCQSMAPGCTSATARPRWPTVRLWRRRRSGLGSWPRQGP